MRLCKGHSQLMSFRRWDEKTNLDVLSVCAHPCLPPGACMQHAVNSMAKLPTRTLVLVQLGSQPAGGSKNQSATVLAYINLGRSGDGENSDGSAPTTVPNPATAPPFSMPDYQCEDSPQLPASCDLQRWETLDQQFVRKDLVQCVSSILQNIPRPHMVVVQLRIWWWRRRQS